MDDDTAEQPADSPTVGTNPPPLAEVTVQGPGISITRPVDEATMAGIIALLFGAAPVSPPRGGGGSHGGASTQPRGGAQSSTQWDDDLTLGEFIRETQAATFPQKICAAGYYLINMQGAESFDRERIRAALVNAHEDLPGNFSRDWIRAASSNLIAAKPGDSGQFYVPKTGRTAVESHFQDVPKRRSGRRPTKKTAKSEDAG